MGWLAIVLAVFVGLLLGLMGGGGSILMVPLLTYVAGLDAKEAIAGSLFVVGVTSLVSVGFHAKAGNVRWRTGLVFGAAGMVGAALGGVVGGFLPGTLLLIAFALMMLVTAWAMIRPRRTTAQAVPADHAPSRRLGRILLDGVAVGFVTGIVGAGGGFLVVPALVLLAGLPMSAAVGTSLLVIAMKSFAGLGGYLTSVSLDWPFLLAVTGVAVLGALAGVALVQRVPERALKTGFGWFVLVMGVVMLVTELVGLIA